jgi:spoIIIJ-associated protein
MKIYEFEGKSLNEIKEKALTELNSSEDELYIRETEEAGGFLKGKKYKLEIITKDEVIKFAKEFIIEIAKGLGATINIEAKKRDHFIQLNIFSESSSILIGKFGKTIDALQTLIKSSIFNTTGFKVNVMVDVEDYKEKVNRHLEFDVKKIAREVLRTGIEAKLDPMNSYERRIVHNAINEINGVSTISEGEEPNRYVVIKKDEK